MLFTSASSKCISVHVEEFRKYIFRIVKLKRKRNRGYYLALFKQGKNDLQQNLRMDCYYSLHIHYRLVNDVLDYRKRFFYQLLKI